MDTPDGSLLVPIAADVIHVYGWAARAFSHARLRVQGDGVVADIVVTDGGGELLAELRGLVFRRATRESLAAVPAALYELTWQTPTVATPNGTTPHGRWLILGDCAHMGRDLEARLRSRGHDVTLLGAGDAVPPAPTEPWTGVVDLRAVDTAAHGPVGAPPLQAAIEATGDALALAQALEAAVPAPRLWVVTRGAQPVQHRGADLALAQSPLWGLGRVIALERPELRATLVDLDPATENAEELAAEAAGGRRRAIRGVARWRAPRVASVSLRSRGERAGAGIAAPGGGASRCPRQPRVGPCAAPAPGPGEVEIQVDASA